MQRMSEQEAIEIHIAENIHRIEVIENFMYRVPDADKEKCRKNISVLSKINGLLQEIQQYRAIGTVEEVKYLISSYNDMIHDFGNDMELLERYKAIGTVEECREAVERMKPKKVKKIQIPNTSWSKACTRFECPSCNKYLNYMELSHCGLCGQEIDWSE